jgi:glycerol-3-phosphate responsive antiterminator
MKKFISSIVLALNLFIISSVNTIYHINEKNKTRILHLNLIKQLSQYFDAFNFIDNEDFNDFASFCA